MRGLGPTAKAPCISHKCWNDFSVAAAPVIQWYMYLMVFPHERLEVGVKKVSVFKLSTYTNSRPY